MGRPSRDAEPRHRLRSRPHRQPGATEEQAHVDVGTLDLIALVVDGAHVPPLHQDKLYSCRVTLRIRGQSLLHKRTREAAAFLRVASPAPKLSLVLEPDTTNSSIVPRTNATEPAVEKRGGFGSLQLTARDGLINCHRSTHAPYSQAGAEGCIGSDMISAGAVQTWRMLLKSRALASCLIDRSIDDRLTLGVPSRQTCL